MTVSYTAKVSSAKSFGCFLQLLFRWRGSIYKLVWPDLTFFLIVYFSLSITYRFFLGEAQQRIFERIAAYCDKYGTLIPVSFVLGFYVSIVVGRWWQQYQSIPWIDTLAIWVNSNVTGMDEKDRLLRRTIVRYACLSITQCFTLISPRVKKRFPTLDYFVESGLMLENEKEMIAEINERVDKKAKYPTHFVPLVWCSAIVTRARRGEKITNDSAFRAMMDEILKIKDKCALLISYDWISVPLVYTQVVTLAVYVYFFSCIMGRQWVKNPGGTDGGGEASSDSEQLKGHRSHALSSNIDLIFPVFTVLQFFFYMGWLKVAESLLNPFGDDDDDFELNWIVDRNIQAAYLIVDEMHHSPYPDLLKDQYWEVVVPEELPHTFASGQYKEQSHFSSTANLNLLSSSLKTRPEQEQASVPGTPASKRGSIRRSTSTSLHSQMTSVGSVANRLNRLGSAFKKAVTRERSPARGGDTEFAVGSIRDTQGGMGMATSVDVIPELDENMITIVSTKSGKPRPTVQDIFPKEEVPMFVMEGGPHLEPLPTSYDAMTVRNDGDAKVLDEESQGQPTSESDDSRTILLTSANKDKVLFY